LEERGSQAARISQESKADHALNSSQINASYIGCRSPSVSDPSPCEIVGCNPRRKPAAMAQAVESWGCVSRVSGSRQAPPIKEPPSLLNCSKKGVGCFLIKQWIGHCLLKLHWRLILS
jgi:hypothetical protein